MRTHQDHQERVETLRAKLEEQYGFETDADAVCEVCGADNPSIDPGTSFDDLQHRCPEHTRLRIKYWLFPGNHPTMPAANNLFECDECGDEWVFPYGVYALSGERHTDRFDHTESRCLDCVTLEWIIHFCESQNRMDGFEEMYDDEELATDGGTEAQCTILDCPKCNDAEEARYLGTVGASDHGGHIVGWECLTCESELEEHVDSRGSSFDLRVADDSDEVADE